MLVRDHVRLVDLGQKARTSGASKCTMYGRVVHNVTALRSCIPGADPGLDKKRGPMANRRWGWLIWPGNRLILHDLAVKRGAKWCI